MTNSVSDLQIMYQKKKKRINLLGDSKGKLSSLYDCLKLTSNNHIHSEIVLLSIKVAMFHNLYLSD